MTSMRIENYKHYYVKHQYKCVFDKNILESRLKKNKISDYYLKTKIFKIKKLVLNKEIVANYNKEFKDVHRQFLILWSKNKFRNVKYLVWRKHRFMNTIVDYRRYVSSEDYWDYLIQLYDKFIAEREKRERKFKENRIEEIEYVKKQKVIRRFHFYHSKYKKVRFNILFKQRLLRYWLSFYKNYKKKFEKLFYHKRIIEKNIFFFSWLFKKTFNLNWDKNYSLLRNSKFFLDFLFYRIFFLFKIIDITNSDSFLKNIWFVKKTFRELGNKRIKSFYRYYIKHFYRDKRINFNKFNYFSKKRSYTYKRSRHYYNKYFFNNSGYLNKRRNFKRINYYKFKYKRYSRLAPISKYDNFLNANRKTKHFWFLKAPITDQLFNIAKDLIKNILPKRLKKFKIFVYKFKRSRIRGNIKKYVNKINIIKNIKNLNDFNFFKYLKILKTVLKSFGMKFVFTENTSIYNSLFLKKFINFLFIVLENNNKIINKFIRKSSKTNYYRIPKSERKKRYYSKNFKLRFLKNQLLDEKHFKQFDLQLYLRKFLGCFVKNGKKKLVKKILIKIIKILNYDNKINIMIFFRKLFYKLRPILFFKKYHVGKKLNNIPFFQNYKIFKNWDANRRFSKIAVFWLVRAIRIRKEKTLALRIVSEFYDVLKNKGNTIDSKKNFYISFYNSRSYKRLLKLVTWI